MTHYCHLNELQVSAAANWDIPLFDCPLNPPCLKGVVSCLTAPHVTHYLHVLFIDGHFTMEKDMVHARLVEYFG